MAEDQKLRDIQTDIDTAIEVAKRARDDASVVGQNNKARALALVVTKLEEAELWLTKCW